MGGIVPILQMMPGVNRRRVEKLASDPGCLASLAKFSVFSSIALQEKGISNACNRTSRGPKARMWLVR